MPEARRGGGERIFLRTGRRVTSASQCELLPTVRSAFTFTVSHLYKMFEATTEHHW